MSVDLAPLLTVLRRRLTAIDGPVGQEVARVNALLDRVAGPQQAFEPSFHPLTRHLSATLDGLDHDAAEIAQVLRPLAVALPWRYGYAARTDLPGLEANMGWAEIVGPLAPYRSDDVCLGLTLIGANTFYPPHRHPAVELYHVLTGTSEWTADGETSVRKPGAFILHTANQEHAMRGGERPLLALYTWSGDIVSPSVWSDGQ